MLRLKLAEQTTANRRFDRAAAALLGFIFLIPPRPPLVDASSTPLRVPDASPLVRPPTPAFRIISSSWPTSNLALFGALLATEDDEEMLGEEPENTFASLPPALPPLGWGLPLVVDHAVIVLGAEAATA